MMLRRGRPLPFLLPLLIALCSSLCGFGVSHASSTSQPLQGQGFPPGTPTDVYVSAMLERLLSIDETNYHFTSLQFLYLSWRDARALGSMEESTEAYRNGTLQVCKKPCTSSVSLLPRENGNTMNDEETQAEDVDSSSSSQYESAPEYSCCDGVWLPSIIFMNTVDVPTVQRYAIDINTIEDKDGVEVVYWVEILAEYFTPMDFRLFPYDQQELVARFNSPTQGVARFIPSVTSTTFWMNPEDTDTTSGWAIESLNITTKQMTNKDFFSTLKGTAPAAGDPSPLGDSRSSISKMSLNEFDIRIKVKRLNKMYLLDSASKLGILLILSFLSYLIPAEYFGNRLSMNLTLFLTLTALNITLTQNLPSTSYPTIANKFIFMSFVVVAFAVPECLFSHAIATRSAPGEPDDSSASAVSPALLGPLFSRVWNSKSKVWDRLKSVKHAKKVAFAIDMVCLSAMILTVVISILVILAPTF